MQGCTATAMHRVTRKRIKEVKVYRKYVQKEHILKRYLLIVDLKGNKNITQINLKTLKTLWPLLVDGVQLPQG